MSKLDAQIQAYLQALSNSDLEAVKSLVAEGLAINQRVQQGQDLLATAMGQHRWQIAEYLLTQGANPKTMISGYYSALGWACLYNQPELVKQLMQSGASIYEFDKQSLTALHWAVQARNEELVKLFLEAGADPNARRKESAPPIFSALQLGSIPILKQLMAAGASLEHRDSNQRSVLHMAVYSQSLELFQFLLRHFKLVNAQNQFGQTALHLCAYFDLPAIISCLLQAGANPNLRDQAGLTPLMQAASAGQLKNFEILLKAGTQFDEADQQQAFKMAIQGRHELMAQRLLGYFDLSGPIHKDHPFLSAIETKQWKLVQGMLQHGVDADATVNQTGNTPSLSLLQWSQQQYLPELTRLLLEAGAKKGREQAIPWLDNLMLLRKNSQILLPKNLLQALSEVRQQPIDPKLLLMLQKNIEPLGFVLSNELAERVLNMSLTELDEFYQLLIPALRGLVGADKAFSPMYPNFPQQVKNLSDVELKLNALLHYWGDWIGQRILPHYDKLPRPALDEQTEKTKLKSIGLAGPDDVQQLFSRLLQAKSSLRPEDKQDLVWLVFSRAEQIINWLPEQVPYRENSALLAATLLRHTALYQQAAEYVKTGVDVLRTATALADGDISLAENTRFPSYSKAIRRWLLERFEAVNNLDEDLWRHPEKFKRLAERLHPGEYRKRYPQTFEAFKRLRSGQAAESYSRVVETHLAKGQVSDILPLLNSRPGDFARRLDHLLRLSRPEGAEAVVQAFAKVVNKLPSALALQLRHHFEHRLQMTELRVFFPKGDLAKLQAIDNFLPPLGESVCRSVSELCRQALLNNYATRKPLGSCWLDERLKAYTVPFAMRSASKALHTISRGSRIPFGESVESATETMRFFIWWKDGKSRTDIDLSALVLDQDFEYQTTLAYYNLKELGGTHSGDITSAPNGASEFIDIELSPFLARGSRYVMMVINSFTTQPYCDLPECFAGFMQRQKPNSGEIYEPRTLANKFDLTANTTIAIPLILDLKNREVIWTDLSLSRNPSTVNNVHGNRSSLSLLCEAMVSLSKPSLYDLFALHIQARGQEVSQPDSAEHVFSSEPCEASERMISAFDIPKILAEYL